MVTPEPPLNVNSPVLVVKLLAASESSDIPVASTEKPSTASTSTAPLLFRVILPRAPAVPPAPCSPEVNVTSPPLPPLPLVFLSPPLPAVIEISAPAPPPPVVVLSRADPPTIVISPQADPEVPGMSLVDMSMLLPSA